MLHGTIPGPTALREISQVNVFGVPKRPFEVITASVLGFIAPFFVLAALVWMAFTGGRAFRIVGWVLRKIGDLTDTAVLSWAGDLSSGIATGIVAIAFVVGLIVIVGFTAYAWRLAVGRGRARWVAMGCSWPGLRGDDPAQSAVDRLLSAVRHCEHSVRLLAPLLGVVCPRPVIGPGNTIGRRRSGRRTGHLTIEIARGIL